MKAKEYIEQSDKLKNYFSEFTEDDIDKIEVINYSPGDIINNKTKESDSVFIILKGICSVSKKIKNGELIKYYYLCKNDVFGFANVIIPNNKAQKSKIRAITQSILLKIPKLLFTRFSINYAHFEHKIVINIIEKLHDALSFNIECKKYNSTINIVSYLLFTYKVYHSLLEDNYSGNVTINETRSTISNFTGISIRSINNTIDLLKKLNYITLIKGKVNINAEKYELLKTYKENNI